MSITIKLRVFLLTGTAVFALAGMWGLFNYVQARHQGLQEIRYQTALVHTDMLTLRRHEKDFLARLDLKYRDQFDADFRVLEGRLDALHVQMQALGLAADATDGIAIPLRGYAGAFKDIVAVQQDLGLDEKSGLHGRLREAVHAAEEAMKTVSEERLLKDMLMLRRHEKDFLQRLDLKYREKFDKDFEVLRNDLAGSAVSDALRETIGERMGQYRKDFAALVQGYERRGLKPDVGVVGNMRRQVQEAEEGGRQTAAHIQQVLDVEEGRLRSLTLVAAMLLAAFVIGLGVGLAWSIIRPIRAAVQRMEDLAFGSGDLSATLDAARGDEMGLLASAFNTFVGKIRGVVVDTADAASQLAAAAEENARIAEETNTTIHGERGATGQVVAAVRQMADSAQEVARSAQQAAGAAAHAAQESAQGRLRVEGSIKTIQGLADEVGRAAEVVQRLARNSEDIGSVLDVIRGVAEQTNLLALNAAIEAARAGESGRGFAVVADEVRTLASRTQKSTEEIQAMIARLKADVDDAVRVMQGSARLAAEGVNQVEGAGGSLGAITTSIGRINDMNMRIAGAAEQQSTVAEDVNRSVVAISQSMDHLVAGGEQNARSAEELARLADDLRTTARQFRV